MILGIVMCLAVVAVVMIGLLYITGAYKHARWHWLPRQALPESRLMWSRMWDTEPWYRGLHTENYVTPSHLKDDCRVLWIRMNSEPGGDIERFIQHVLPHRRNPFVLVTSDGDRSIPSDVQDAHVIIQHPLCEGWFTQNFDGTSSFVRPIPIGLSLHSFATSHDFPSLPAMEEAYLQTPRVPLDQRSPRLFSDCHFKCHPKFGNPRKAWKGFMKQLDFVDTPEQKLPVVQLWERHGAYRYVMSLSGNGLDCHRTWEALGLGAVVVTLHTSLDGLLAPFRVIFLDRFAQLQDDVWLQKEYERVSVHPLPTMQASYWKAQTCVETFPTNEKPTKRKHGNKRLSGP